MAQKAKQWGRTDGYGTSRAVPTCKRCHQQHYNMIPCREMRDQPTHKFVGFRIDPKDGNPEPQRITRNPANLPEGFHERGDEMRTLVRFPGNRFYRNGATDG